MSKPVALDSANRNALKLNRRSALVALLVTVPVPALGTGLFHGLHHHPDLAPYARGIWIALKIYILIIPALWHVLVDRQPLRLRFNPTRGLAVAFATGIAMSIAVWAWFTLVFNSYQRLPEVTDWDRVLPPLIALGLFFIFINAFIEEYIWRWFVFRHAEALMGTRIAAVFSAACFLVNHIIGMSRHLEPVPLVLALTGIFMAALAWQWLFVRYRSLWPGYVSHAIADAAIVGMIFIALLD